MDRDIDGRIVGDPTGVEDGIVEVEHEGCTGWRGVFAGAGASVGRKLPRQL